MGPFKCPFFSSVLCPKSIKVNFLSLKIYVHKYVTWSQYSIDFHQQDCLCVASCCHPGAGLVFSDLDHYSTLLTACLPLVYFLFFWTYMCGCANKIEVFKEILVLISLFITRPLSSQTTRRMVDAESTIFETSFVFLWFCPSYHVFSMPGMYFIFFFLEELFISKE